MFWKTIHETAGYKYEQHRLTRRRRARPKKDGVRAPQHSAWLKGGELKKKPRVPK